MTEFDFEFVQSKISYYFKKKDLLLQAFRRKSYAQENGLESNELLEFLGDEVLDFYVTRILVDEYAYVKKNDADGNKCDQFASACLYTEKEFTEIKTKFVDNEMLAKRIDKMKLADYMFLGKGDTNEANVKVKADLFEAILGAIAIDSNWNADVLQNSVAFMLDSDYYLKTGFEKENSYVEIIQQISQKRYGVTPEYTYTLLEKDEKSKEDEYLASIDFKIGKDVKTFTAKANTKNRARYECAKMIYDALLDAGLLFSIRDDCPSQDEVDIDNAINILQELHQKGWLSIPIYDFEEDGYDKDGNQIWKCTLTIHNYCMEKISTSSNKKLAKKIVAYECLCDIMGYTSKYTFVN